ncbi:MAG: nucleotidyltransferase family protein [Spirochaetales bacterium]
MSSAADRFGIAGRSFSILLDVVRSCPEVERVLVFGSRAMGTAAPGSDIDIAIDGSQAGEAVAAELSRDLNERRPIPYHVDVVALATLHHQELRDHIEQVGQEIHRRE